MEFTKQTLTEFTHLLKEVIAGRAKKSDLVMYVCSDLNISLNTYTSSWEKTWLVDDMAGRVVHVSKLDESIPHPWWSATVSVGRVKDKVSSTWPYKKRLIVAEIDYGFSALTLEELNEQIANFLFDQILSDDSFFYGNNSVLLKQNDIEETYGTLFEHGIIRIEHLNPGKEPC